MAETEPFFREALVYCDDHDVATHATARGGDELCHLAWAGLPIAEASWLAGNDTARERLQAVRGRLTDFETTWLAAVIAWQHRLGVRSDVVPALAPYAAQYPVRRAAQLWETCTTSAAGSRSTSSHRRTRQICRRRASTTCAICRAESKGTVFCLVEAPDADAASAVHREAHGLVADEVLEVQEGS